MRVLITGSEGFIGHHLSGLMESRGDDVIKCSYDEMEGFVRLDITDTARLHDALEKYRPDVLINLAGQSSVAYSWKDPRMTVELNVIGSLNILETVRKDFPGVRVVLIGSSDEYGLMSDNSADVKETAPLSPKTPYAISKATQDQFAFLYSKVYGIDVCLVRCFNLAGPYQRKGFMIPDFASGIAEIEKGLRDHMSVGNLEAARDFTHIKDAVEAIRLVAEKGKKGEVYNICSGKAYKAQTVLDMLCSMSDREIKIRRDPERQRPNDVPVIYGNHDKLTAHTGWTPKYDMDDILKDVLAYWRSVQ